MESFSYYIFVLIAIIVGFFIIKKVTTCLIKSLLCAILVAALLAIYWMYFRV